VAEVADAMALWQEDFTKDQADFFDLLCALMEEHDKAKVKWPKLDGREMLRHLLKQPGLTAADLSRLLAAAGTWEP
jgi:hypothetical protein